MNVEELNELAKSVVDDLNAEIYRLREALEFYADPDSYFGVLIVGDGPCGAFASDISDVEHEFFETCWGASAREALTLNTFEN